MTLVHHTETVVVGAGQAALTLSRSLSHAGHDHVLLERGRIGERWRSERWESLTLLTPNWLNRLPGQRRHADGDGFLAGRDFVDALESYAWSFLAPVVEGVSVLRVEPLEEGFRVVTDRGVWRSRNVVDASGDCAVPLVPRAAGALPSGLDALHASRYRSPGALPAGGVLVVGAGPTGQQLALELAEAGRDVVLAVGRHASAPRRYRGQDVFRWLADLGELDRTLDEVADPRAALRSPSFVLSGADGGRQLDLAVLAAAGVRLTGRLHGFEGTRALFADDLAGSVADAERRWQRLRGRIGALAGRRGSPASPPTARIPVDGTRTRVDLRAAGISTVVWATGYRRATTWLPAAALRRGEIAHRRGVTPVPGLYVLGLRFQHRRSSHFIGGVGRDAAFVARRILAGANRARRPAGARDEALPAAA